MWTVKCQHPLCLQMKVAYAGTTPPFFIRASRSRIVKLVGIGVRLIFWSSISFVGTEITSCIGIADKMSYANLVVPNLSVSSIV